MGMVAILVIGQCAPYEIWAKLAMELQRRRHLKILTDGCTDAQRNRQTDDGQKVITIAHHEHTSGELKRVISVRSPGLDWSCYATLCLGGHLGLDQIRLPPRLLSWILELNHLAILNLHVTPMPPIKFWLNLTYCLGADVIYRFSRWLPWRPSWISE